MLLGAFGTLVWDRIRHPSGGRVVEQWGGAVYSLSALSASCPPGWEVEPILKVGADRAAAARERLASLPHVRPGAGFRTVPAVTNQVELRYLDAAHRDEVLTGGVPPWSWDELEPLIATQTALYLNFISGFEMELETAERVRRAFRGPIYADLHSLFLGPPGVGPRIPRALPDWERWLACFDAIQVNESELGLLLGAGDADPAPLLDRGPALVLVTLGERGARFAARLRPGSRFAASATDEKEGVVAPARGPVAGDPTGCGDVWGSVTCAGLLAGLSVRDAIRRANRCAAAKILHPATHALHVALKDALAG